MQKKNKEQKLVDSFQLTRGESTRDFLFEEEEEEEAGLVVKIPPRVLLLHLRGEREADRLFSC